MKSKLKKLSVLALCFLFLLSGCGTVIDTYDPNKTQIYVKVFNGGNGVEWIEDVRDEFNAANEEYEVVLRFDKELSPSIITSIRQGNPEADCYFTTDLTYQEAIYQDMLEDLSDVLEMEVDGEGKGTIREKIKNFDDWQNVASKRGQGTYMLPYADSVMGFVYNHDLFVKNGWLDFADASDKAALENQGIVFTEKTNGDLIFVSSAERTNYEEGDVILKPGKDGLYGTYDDGQPLTERDFDDMLDNIVYGNANAKTFLYNGIYDHYTNHIAYAVMAQYMGIDHFEAYFSYDTGETELPLYGGDSKKISLENGYEVYQADGVHRALSFLDKYLNDEGRIDSDSLKTTSFSHTDAQNNYILSYKKNTGYPAMLVEGAWWENEARRMFNEVETNSQGEYGYGKIDYRYMLLPELEGQKGIDGEGNGTVMSAQDSGSIIVLKNEDREKVAKIKEFVAMTCRTETIVDFTKRTGIIRPYQYTLSESDLEEMTPFAQNMWQLYNDTKNITIVRPEILKNSDPLTFTTTASSYVIPIKDTATYNISLVRALRTVGSADAAMEKVGYTASEWAGFVEAAKSQGFFA